MSEELLQEETTMADLEEHFDDANPWNVVQSYMENKTILPVKVEGIVNGGAIAMVEGLRGFIPASKLSLSYIEDLETYLLKDIEVRVIEVNQAEERLILSAREILKEKEKKAMEEKIAGLKTGTVLTGKVESLQNYGAFVRLEDGLSGPRIPDQPEAGKIPQRRAECRRRGEGKDHRHQRRQDQPEHESPGRTGRSSCRKGRNSQIREHRHQPGRSL